MTETKIKSLGEARDIIAELEAKTGYKRPLNQEPIQTLAAAKSYISFLQAKLGKPSVKVPSEFKSLTTSKPSALPSLPSLETIQAELNAAATPEARAKLLITHAKAYRAQARAVKSCSVEQTQLLSVLRCAWRTN